MLIFLPSPKTPTSTEMNNPGLYPAKLGSNLPMISDKKIVM